MCVGWLRFFDGSTEKHWMLACVMHAAHSPDAERVTEGDQAHALDKREAGVRTLQAQQKMRMSVV